MAKLILMFDEQVLREIPVGPTPLGIGRLPDNAVMIDNPAVSSRHARVIVQGGQYIVEDLKSLNGTFVNEQRITRHTLQHGDAVLVGKHTLLFDATAEKAAPATQPASAPAAPVQDLGGTVFLDTKAHKEMLSKMAAEAESKAEALTARMPAAQTAGRAAAAPAQLGVLTVLSGSTDQPQYVLEGQTALIGKSKTALVRLKGWFKPDVAAAITRKRNSYVVTPLAGKTRVNRQPLTGPYELQEGDVVEVSGVSLQFTLQ